MVRATLPLRNVQAARRPHPTPQTALAAPADMPPAHASPLQDQGAVGGSCEAVRRRHAPPAVADHRALGIPAASRSVASALHDDRPDADGKVGHRSHGHVIAPPPRPRFDLGPTVCCPLSLLTSRPASQRTRPHMCVLASIPWQNDVWAACKKVACALGCAALDPCPPVPGLSGRPELLMTSQQGRRRMREKQTAYAFRAPLLDAFNMFIFHYRPQPPSSSRAAVPRSTGRLDSMKVEPSPPGYIDSRLLDLNRLLGRASALNDARRTSGRPFSPPSPSYASASASSIVHLHLHQPPLSLVLLSTQIHLHPGPLPAAAAASRRAAAPPNHGGVSPRVRPSRRAPLRSQRGPPSPGAARRQAQAHQSPPARAPPRVREFREAARGAAAPRTGAGARRS